MISFPFPERAEEKSDLRAKLSAEKFEARRAEKV
jgi:hypothetical protein